MKLTYEDCKELDEHGFPQGDYSSNFWYVDDIKGFYQSGVDKEVVSGELNGHSKIVRIPTLSELIEACGLQFMSLIAPCVYDENWIAWGSNYKEEGRRSKGTGSSPEQAVKNLWIALNKD